MKEHRTRVTVTLPTQNFMFIILDASGYYSYMNASSFTDIVFRLCAHSESQSQSQSRGTRDSLEESSEGTEQLTALTRAGQTKQKFFLFLLRI